MKVILNCTNLIGDSIYLLNPVKAFLEQHPNECVAIVTDKGFAYDMFYNVFCEEDLCIFDSQEQAVNRFPQAQLLYVGAGQSGEICFAETSKGGKQLHISEGYAKILGVTLTKLQPTVSWQRVPDDVRLDPYILISPFSRSCSSHSGQPANKTLEDWKWEHLVRYLRDCQDLPVKVIAGPNDYMKNCSISVNDYISCRTLYDLELTLKSAKMLVTLDNGIGHVAAALELPMIYLWPKVSNLGFIAPIWNARAKYLMMEPTQAAPVAMFVGFRKFVRELLENNSEEFETLILEQTT